MSHRKDTDYLAISARVHAMENRLLNRERMERMIEARDAAEAAKLLAECGYEDGGALTPQRLEELLAQSRSAAFREIRAAVPDPRLVEIFQVKYDYHNAKVLLKAEYTGQDAERLLASGGRWDPRALQESFQRGEVQGCTEPFRAALSQARETLAATRDPQLADFILDRACFGEMAQMAQDSPFLKGYVQISVDAANLRTAVRAARMDRGSDFLNRALLEGGSVSPKAIANARGQELAERFSAGPLAQAAAVGSRLLDREAGSLTEFERLCDDAVTQYVSAARRVPFGEQTVIGYLYAKEAEVTAARIILSGRMAGLDPEIIRSRLRAAYA